MALSVVGAGLPRTGTRSLKTALERLLGQPCYHMVEVFPRDEHLAEWHRVAHGGPPEWDALFAGWSAAVDYPASAFWRELADHYPQATVVLTHREPVSWWRSARATIFDSLRANEPERRSFREMSLALFRRDLGLDRAALDRPEPPDEVLAALAHRTERVRAAIPAERLVEWTPGAGWEPLCTALGRPIPDEPYPHENTTAAFRAGRA